MFMIIAQLVSVFTMVSENNSVYNVQLNNDHIGALIGKNGDLLRVDNMPSSESYHIKADTFTIVTDQGSFSNKDVKSIKYDICHKRVCYIFSNRGIYDVILEYTLAPENKYIRRRLMIDNIRKPFTLLDIELGRTAFRNVPKESIKYDTFWNAPTVNFLRWDDGGLFMGIENPFFEVTSKDSEIVFSYEPSLLLKVGDTYKSESQFIGVYKKSNRMITDHYPKTALSHEEGINRPRFRNPSGHIPIDQNEIRGMREFASEYLDLRVDNFMSILYCYWYPMPQLPNTPEAEAQYYRMIDNFHDLGGDMIIFNPLIRYDLPTNDLNSYWDLAPEDSTAQCILKYADSKGIKYGFYMGVAAQGDRGNASALPFCPDKSDWKKVDMTGTLGKENCIGCNDYADWWFKVQKNTIAKYNLSLWSWDPGPGNAFFCYSDKHGHIPGKGGYKGWRNSTEILGRLKEEFPNLYIQGYYGRKEYGLWGLKYLDQHESYWEQTVPFLATMHPDIHADRINADGVRLQNWWNENFRFLPTVTNHVLTHRIQENSFDSRLPRVWDHLGWKYSLMSGLAVGGSITACILPEDLDNVQGIREFYQKWLIWSRNNFEYVKYNVSFGDQFRIGGIDGHSRIKGDHGFIFLCNLNPRPTSIQFNLNDEIGLYQNGQFTLKELYPKENCYYFDETNHRGVYGFGDAVSVVVPEYQVLLLELNRFKEEQLPIFFGISGKKNAEGKLSISEVNGEQGTVTEMVIMTQEKQNPTTIEINGQLIPIVRDREYLHAKIKFAGHSLCRMLDDWRMEDAHQFLFPYHNAVDSICLTTKFHADPEIRKLLESAKPSNSEEIDQLIEKWKNDKLPDVYTWARPDRLFFIIPFTDAEQVKEVTMQINGKDALVECFIIRNTKIIYYADITDMVEWKKDNTISLYLCGMKANQFLGPYLDYPSSAITSHIAVTDHHEHNVIYNKPIDPEMPERWNSTKDSQTPAIVSWTIDPETIREDQSITLSVTTDMQADELQGVYISTGFPPEDRAMQYDANAKVWIFTTIAPNRRWIILDSQAVYVWAVAKSGCIGEAQKIPIKWLFQ